MSCAIHSGKDDIQVCKKCGREMCADCAAFSDAETEKSFPGSGGLCPVCLEPELGREVKKQRNNMLLFFGISVVAIVAIVILGIFEVLNLVISLVAAGLWLVYALYSGYKDFKRYNFLLTKQAYLKKMLAGSPPPRAASMPAAFAGDAVGADKADTDTDSADTVDSAEVNTIDADAPEDTETDVPETPEDSE